MIIDLNEDVVSEIETRTNKAVIVSVTGRAHGYGSHIYKWVSRLSAEERKAVQCGSHIVLVTGCAPGTNGSSGITYRQVIYKNGRYDHRMI